MARKQVALPKFEDGTNFGDLLDPAIDIALQGEKEQAMRYVEQYAEYLTERNPDWSDEKIRETISRNIGYWAGYYGVDAMKAVKDIFGYGHPVFGEKIPTAQEAFDAGRKLGKIPSSSSD